MTTTFLGQGYSNDNQRSVHSLLRESLKDERFNQSTWLSAFVSQAALESLGPEINIFLETGEMKIFVGVDQKATPLSALRKLLSFNFPSYVVHWHSNTIFHPKCYFFEGPGGSRIIIGSSNLTLDGLANNLENSVMVEFSNGDPEGEAFMKGIQEFYHDIFDATSDNVKPLTEALLADLSGSGVVPERAVYERSNEQASNQGFIDRIKDLFPKLTRKHFREYPRNRRSNTSLAREATPAEAPAEMALVPETNPEARPSAPLWEKANLPGSDVAYTKPGTNTTGRLKLVQAGHNIDQTRYFRYDIFRELNWIRREHENKEDATANFRIIIFGDDKGVHGLGITHNPAGVADQGNYTTSISWSGAVNIITENDLREKTLQLFDSSLPDEDFVLNIF